MNAYKMLGGALAGAMLMVGCGVEEGPGVVNPASAYCEDAGYMLEIRKTGDGDLGICHFGDGEECEEWAFLHGECGIERTFCAMHGYAPELRDGELFCVFSEGSSCPELDFANGTCAP